MFVEKIFTVQINKPAKRGLTFSQNIVYCH